VATREELAGAYPDVSAADVETMVAVAPYTMTSPDRVFALAGAVRYLARRGIAGAIVECGVWKGGSMLAAARTLAVLGDTARELYLFDTYEGMPPPSEHDVAFDGTPAQAALAAANPADAWSVWCRAPLDGVKAVMRQSGYPAERIHYVQGRVEDTVPGQAPDAIALLRLDTDWHGSVAHALEHLYPRLASGGVLIIDDYGHWRGARKATDEFIARTPGFGLLTRIDYTGRLAVKP
jgi:O-methyltransferase